MNVPRTINRNETLCIFKKCHEPNRDSFEHIAAHHQLPIALIKAIGNAEGEFGDVVLANAQRNRTGKVAKYMRAAGWNLMLGEIDNPRMAAAKRL